VLDRATGEFLSSFNVPEVFNWMTGVTEDGKLVGRSEPALGKTQSFCPSTAGAKSWNSTAYSPRTGFLYTPTNELCNDITSNATKPTEGRFFMNGDFPATLPPNRSTYSHVDAWDPVTGKRIWSVPYKYILLSSMLATAGDVVFTGDPEGNFFALDARSGNKLWSFQTGAGHRGASISYSVGGRQYIAVTTGFQQTIVGGAALGLFPEESFRAGSTLVVFALPEGSR
jgi:alcohol dehydrogenase (cytochrome c)